MGRARRLTLAGIVLATVLAGVAATTPPASAAAGGHEWTRFGVDAARANALPAGSGIGVASLSRLRRQQVALPGTADSSAVYASGVTVGTARHDIFVVTTTYGRTVAIDAGSGQILWTFTPPGYASWAGTSQITTGSPLLDATARVVYTASPDGRVHALRLADGRESRGWPVTVTGIRRTRRSRRR